MDTFTAFSIVIWALFTKGIWAFGALTIVLKVVPFVQARMSKEDEMTDEDIFNMYG